MVAKIHFELSANKILGDPELLTADTSGYYLPRINLISGNSYKFNTTSSIWLNVDNAPCRYLRMNGNIGTDTSSYFPSMDGVAMFGNHLYAIADTIPIHATD